jgi:hypothetical protein
VLSGRKPAAPRSAPSPPPNLQSSPCKYPSAISFGKALGWTCAYQGPALPCWSGRHHILGKWVDLRDVAASPLRRCCTLPCVHSILGRPSRGREDRPDATVEKWRCIGANCSRLGGGWSHVHPACTLRTMNTAQQCFHDIPHLVMDVSDCFRGGGAFL